MPKIRERTNESEIKTQHHSIHNQFADEILGVVYEPGNRMMSALVMRHLYKDKNKSRLKLEREKWRRATEIETKQ